jgi:hypothetical protein
MGNATTDPLIGHRIVMIRPMMESEKELVGWVDETESGDKYAEDREWCAAGVAVLVLSNGATVFAACDPELNSGGHLVTACKGLLYDIFA